MEHHRCLDSAFNKVLKISIKSCGQKENHGVDDSNLRKICRWMTLVNSELNGLSHSNHAYWGTAVNLQGRRTPEVKGEFLW